ncbi:MAG: hypothetical protein KDD82_08260 [Planctomycetes bacterium]|nr:hypothetical protein [Planctomycetota bacterium]
MNDEIERLPGRVIVASALCTLAVVAGLFATFVWLTAEPQSTPPALVYKIF